MSDNANGVLRNSRKQDDQHTDAPFTFGTHNPLFESGIVWIRIAYEPLCTIARSKLQLHSLILEIELSLDKCLMLIGNIKRTIKTIKIKILLVCMLHCID